MQRPPGVLVLGGGIAGLGAASSLAAAGIHVILVEKEPVLGGQAASFGCKAAEDCTRCNVCLVEQKVREVKTWPNVEIYTQTRLTEIRGRAGDFLAELEHQPGYLDVTRCRACDACREACPVGAISLLPIASGYPAYRLDYASCLRQQGEACNRCIQACPWSAISFAPQAEIIRRPVAAVIVATGFQAYDPRQKPLLGYGLYPRVLTGLEAERMLLEGDFPPPAAAAAFIQCVGSRDVQNGRGYCSQVCCKYALRLAHLWKQREPHTSIAIFYIDLQITGPGMREVYQACQGQVELVPAAPVEVVVQPDDRLAVIYEDFQGQGQQQRAFDYVILAVGMAPRPENWKMARQLGLNLDAYGFLAPRPDTGIFLAGTCTGPADILTSLTSGQEQAAEVLAFLGRPVALGEKAV